MIKSYNFKGEKPGKKVLILGAVHGNEICWPFAINKIIKDINDWKIEIKRWEVTFIPVCNPEAYKQNKRYIDANLNRVIKYHKDADSYEQKLANELINYIRKADVILDIHSIPSEGKPFVFQDYIDKETEKFAKVLGTKNIVKWWPEMYENTDSSDTIWFAHKNNKLGVLIECGNHNDPKSQETARLAISNTLKIFNITDWKPKFLKQYNSITAEKIYLKNKEWLFEKDRNHLDEIKKWEVIANYENWEKIIMPYDWYILLPYLEAQIWDEWFYIWK